VNGRIEHGKQNKQRGRVVQKSQTSLLFKEAYQAIEHKRQKKGKAGQSSHIA
jgi:hypothetical protein